ncbi:MAG TPA: ATP synthase F0 subunit B [Syntrophales bacterium]|nr:ATP synthase F0 subunit B [Syntrophales bacterium]HQN77967.1 ATP synthase F0 subunit B [Syntrophales bacterium]HQQ26861.1 ATP synthase F0 subunit B [Syntrophales bacterium]
MKGTFREKLSKSFILGTFLPALGMILLVAAVAYASGGAEGEGSHGGGKLMDFVWRVVNFVILAVILYKLAAKGVKGFFTGRRDKIRESMENAISMKEEAERKFKEYDAKLTKATGEIEALTAMIKDQGEAERVKILEDAKATAEKMKEDAKTRIDQEYKRARKELREEAVALSVQMAESILKKESKKSDHDAMVSEFIDRMGRLN